ncbi:DUF429 domain-containing protein [Nibrella saemangeumensis]|uniref:DUF429 domain-containing protein n=1 Tax=Nibrella saemangeumensis TaxID=1084526 RepID=A0ABP8N571_9BACT
MILGMDGCRSGWIAACIDTTNTLTFALFATLEQCVLLQTATLALIDMPIGFAGQQHRLCDSLARDLLKPFRQSSIFFTPHRDAVFASTYAEACRINTLRTGKAISVQTWNICRKIREVAQYTEANPDVRLLESHPELCFYGLAGQVCRYPKRTQSGLSERIRIIEEKAPEYIDAIDQAMHSISRSDAKPDDILDAAILAIIAKRGNLITLPTPDSPESATSRITFGR